MCLDQCIAYGETQEQVRRAMDRTHRWAGQCLQTHRESGAYRKQALFGIVQGGTFPELREESTGYITGLEFDGLEFNGYAIGGLAVGENKEQMYANTGQVAARLPADMPRYLMGVGSPEDLVETVARGVDMFDCVLPTRVARNGALFTRSGRVDVTKRRFAAQSGPVEEGCDCYACQRFSAGYIWHLFRAREMLGPRLASIHNLRFIYRLMGEMREAVFENRFETFRRDLLERLPTYGREGAPAAEGAVAKGQGRIEPYLPPATAGTMLTSSPESVEASRPLRKRTSSPLT